MAQFGHPRLDDVPLSAVLHALADPARLAIVHNLAAAEELSCSAALPDALAPKSTRSNHFKILRAAGLVETRKAGRTVCNRLRRAELDRRFPGLLDSVLAALSRDAA